MTSKQSESKLSNTGGPSFRATMAKAEATTTGKKTDNDNVVGYIKLLHYTAASAEWTTLFVGAKAAAAGSGDWSMGLAGIGKTKCDC